MWEIVGGPSHRANYVYKEVEMTDANRKPTREQIESRAYELYLQRGGEDGNDLTDWLQAEEELNLTMAQPVSQPLAATSTKTSKREAAAA
jgi:DUF2934 family protein